MSEFKDKVAIVTGGSRGIGRAIALMLAEQGCHVAFNYKKNKDAADSLIKELKMLGVKSSANCVDVSDFAKVKEWVSGVVKEFGQLDFLINNAGIIKDKAMMLMSEDDWNDVIDTNLNGTFNVTRSCIVTFLKQKKGRIVNVSSVSGVIGLPRQINYSASKGGMNAMTKALAKEVAAYGVRVNAVAPGFVDTEILSEFNEEQRTQIEQAIPLKRLGNSEEVASCVKFLLSEESKYITGQIIQIDGGLAIR